MKIRMKKDHSKTVDVVPVYFLGNGWQYGKWVVSDPLSGVTVYYSSEMWEEVPTEKWEPANLSICGKKEIVIRSSELSPSKMSQNVVFRLPDNFRAYFLPGGAVRFEERVS